MADDEIEEMEEFWEATKVLTEKLKDDLFAAVQERKRLFSGLKRTDLEMTQDGVFGIEESIIDMKEAIDKFVEEFKLQ